jgi:hypothetical protein
MGFFYTSILHIHITGIQQTTFISGVNSTFYYPGLFFQEDVEEGNMVMEIREQKELDQNTRLLCESYKAITNLAFLSMIPMIFRFWFFFFFWVLALKREDFLYMMVRWHGLAYGTEEMKGCEDETRGGIKSCVLLLREGGWWLCCQDR